MKHVLLGLGSNIEPEKHLLAAAQVIRETFGKVVFSSVYRSKAVGMDGDDFLNACCLVQDIQSHQDLTAWCKALEDVHARDRSLGSWKPRTLDIDVLMVDGEVMDEELYCYAHAYVPAAELIQLNFPVETGHAITKLSLRL